MWRIKISPIQATVDKIKVDSANVVRVRTQVAILDRAVEIPMARTKDRAVSVSLVRKMMAMVMPAKGSS